MVHPYALRSNVLPNALRSVRGGLCGLLLLCSTAVASGQIFPSPGSGPDVSVARMEQTRFLGGVSLAGNLTTYSRGIPMVFTPICNHLDPGSGFGYAVGLTGSYLLGPDLRLVSHLRYASHPGSFERFQAIGRTWAGGDGRQKQVTIRIDSEIDYRALEADLMLSWRVGEIGRSGTGLALEIGPWSAWRLVGTMSQEHVMEIYSMQGEYLSERDVTYFGGEEINRSDLASDAEMTRARDLQYGLRLGTSIDRHLGAGIYLRPGLYVDIAATSMTDFDWGTATTWSLQTDLVVGL